MKKPKFSLSEISSKNIAFAGIITIFCILLLQSSFSLFVDLHHEELAQIDVVFRTSISSIFGYLMSMVSTSDFVIKPKVKIDIPTQKSIGFSQKSMTDTLPPKGSAKTTPPEPSVAPTPPAAQVSLDIEKKNIAVNVQIIVLSLVCIFCLFVLLVVRNFSELIVSNSTNGVTISLFRDIISGSVGGLIGLSRGGD